MILLDPTATDGGGTPAPAAPAAAAAASPPPPPAQPQVVTIPFDQFQAYQQAATRLGELTAAQAQAEREKLQALADKQAQEGHWKQATETMRTTHAAELSAAADRAAGWEARARTYARDTAIMADLAARPNLQPGAAEKVLKLYGDALAAHPEGPGFAVRTETFQGVKDYFDALLADPSNAMFLRPSTTGGAGGGGSAPPPPAAAGAPPTGEAAIVAHWKASRAGNGDTPLWMQPRPGR